MAFKIHKCPICGLEFKTKKSEVFCSCGELCEIQLSAPQTKFMEKVDPNSDKSALVNQQKILKERARAHSRDNELDVLIQSNPADDAVKNSWVGKDGSKRKKMEDK